MKAKSNHFINYGSQMKFGRTNTHRDNINIYKDDRNRSIKKISSNNNGNINIRSTEISPKI